MIRKLLLFLLVLVCFPLVIILPQRVRPEQVFPDEIPFHFPDTLAGKNFDWDSIQSRVGANKGLPPGYEKSALLAYAAYPALKDATINMVLTQSGAPLESNFEFWTLFKNRRKRVYEIRLNDSDDSMFEGILMKDLPFDAQVGILAHELGHVVYYERLSTLQIAKWGLKYLISPKFRATHERSTDLMPVYHGLGSQIYQYAWYIRNDDSTRDLYEKWGTFMDRFYMSDEEIRVVINQMKQH